MLTLLAQIRRMRELRAIKKAEARQRITSARLAALAARPSLRDRRDAA